MRLRDLLDETAVRIGLESVDKETCLEELVDTLVQADSIYDRTGALKAIQARESRATTGIGNGIAIPHGRHASIKSLTAVLGISRNGIQFDSVDGYPVHLVVLLLANVNQPGPHLWALAEISRLVHIPDFCTKAVATDSPAALLELIDSEE
jgi:mannitol/fructose-specific phosphotransferase system IIA component (Ntr-type)